MPTSDRIPVVDLFAGPGGLGEGFSSCLMPNGGAAFRVRLSIEVDPDAHSTLELRTFFREFEVAPKEYYQFLRREITREQLFASHRVQSAAAEAQAWRAELGKVADEELHSRIRAAVGKADEWVLCGGPPCQAYSVVGRSRRGGIDQSDGRVYLYRQYLGILARHRPPVFIMENVKGLLSSRVRESHIFEEMMEDLQDPGCRLLGRGGRSARYKILPLVTRQGEIQGSTRPQDFIIQAEDYGIPQSRHRVILLGLREDLARGSVPALVRARERIPVRSVLDGLAPLRSGITRTVDTSDTWRSAVARTLALVRSGSIPNGDGRRIREEIVRTIDEIRTRSYEVDRGGEFIENSPSIGYRPDWFLDDRIGGVCNHSARPHMESDLQRYLFASCYAKAVGRSPELRDYPVALLPRHRNVVEPGKETYFDDRFRVQLAGQPALTITCHMAKDGHYYIHPDPSQCRSLTVREAARLQTFPDNYFFCGTRTAQYRQVGNAVPPLLAAQVASVVSAILSR